MAVNDPSLTAAATALGTTPRAAESIPGGSIAAAWKLRLSDGRDVFVKTGYPSPDNFAAEAAGLRALAECRAIRVPKVLAVGPEFLALEFIRRTGPAKDFSESLGRGLAELHRREGKTYGYVTDNFIGATPQRNTPPLPLDQGWAAFFWEYRLLPQWKRAEANHLTEPASARLFGRLENVVRERLGEVQEPPVLLHGDLWGGNAITDGNGDPVLIDPAVYYGHRETDVAMMRLFGGFPERVFKAYQEIHPLQRGAEDRRGLYQLYHVLNHWNLFGVGYADQVLALLNRYGRG